MPPYNERLAAFRTEIERSGLDGFILTIGDEHSSEFPADYSQRVGWLSGFRGPTASLTVLMDRAAVFIDGRFTDSVRKEVDAEHWSYVDIRERGIGDWLAAHAPGRRIGFDPRLHTGAALRAIESKLTGGAVMVPVNDHPVDRIWVEQPARPVSRAFAHPIEFAGELSTTKRAQIREWLQAADVDACVIVALDSIGWLFNLRGHDVDTVPVNYAFAIIHRNGTDELFIDPRKLDDDVRRHLGDEICTRPYAEFPGALSAMRGRRVSVDPDLASVAVYSALAQGGNTILEHRDPTVLRKSVKNPVEIAGMKQAHIRDGTALTRFLHWFAIEAPKGNLTELAVSDKVSEFRHEVESLHGLSFVPIAAIDGNAAMPLYRPTPETDAPIKPGGVLLLDSGGQYPNGTTDVTRTVAIGPARAEVKDRFTRVLQGHIAMQGAVFPAGTLGTRLDAIARRALWNGGFDFGHNVGHGVGQFLSVHEGPAFISPIARHTDVPLEAGMILSNEPGYYKAGEYGIRIENLMVVVEHLIEGAEKRMLGFETITLAPIDRHLIDADMLSHAEADWLDAYHARVLAAIGPQLTINEYIWLRAQTAPIRAPRN